MKKLLTIFLLSVILVGCAPANTTLQASGLIEATTLNVATELSGRVVEVLVDEGDSVKGDDSLFVLDDSLLQAHKRTLAAELDLANANLAAAQSTLDMAQLQYEQTLSAALAADRQNRITDWWTLAPDAFDQPAWYFSRSEQINAAQADVDAARVALDEARANLTAVLQEVGHADFLAAETNLAIARAAFLSAREVSARSQALSDARLSDAEKNDYDKLKDAATSTYDEARDALKKAQDTYQSLLETQAAQKVLRARARLSVAQERYYLAMDALRALQTGADSPEVALAAQAVEQARTTLEAAKASVKGVQAQLSEVEAQIEKLTVKAPADGVVLIRNIHPGEVIQAGATTMVIAKLDKLTVTVYIPENRYGAVTVGQSASLNVDSFPHETFSAVVTRIANKAEYTPRNVQTKEERQTTVYAIELSIENPNGKLKPGMPADVTFALANH
ncbi:MAG: HlyD family efflux transporter periplasmic adaptor subunit [Anaerolineales bacterium]